MIFWGDEELLVFLFICFFFFWQFIRFPGKEFRNLLSIHYL